MRLTFCIVDQLGSLLDAQIIECKDPEHAKELALRMVGNHPIEVWKGDRRIFRVFPHGSQGAPLIKT